MHNSLKNRLLVLRVKRHLFSFLLDSGRVCTALVVARTVLQHNLWSSLDINTNSVAEVGMLDGNYRSFHFAIEGDLGEDTSLLLSHNFVHWNLSILQPLDEGNFRAVADREVEGVVGHFDVSLRIIDDALNDFLDDRVVELALHKCVLARVEHEDILSVEVNDFHLFGGHGSGLAEAEIGDETHLLDAVNVAYKQVVVLVHEEDAVGEGKHDSHWEAFGDRDD